MERGIFIQYFNVVVGVVKCCLGRVCAEHVSELGNVRSCV